MTQHAISDQQMQEQEKRDWVSEHFHGGWEMFIDPVAIYDRLAALESQVSAEATWRTIESVPKDGTMVMLFVRHHARAYQINTAHWDGQYWRNMTCTNSDGYYTHWMPLPQPPEAGL